MRVVSLLLLISLIPKTQQSDNQIAPVINDLSIVARLINGISLQSDFMRSSQNLNAVVGELLGIGDSNAIPELLKVKVKDLMKDVDGILEDVKGLAGSSNQNAAIIGETVGILKKIDVEKLKKAAGVNMQALDDKWTDAKRVCLTCLEAEKLFPVVASLKYVMNTANDEASKTDMQSHLKYFFDHSRNIPNAFRGLQYWVPDFKDLWEIIGTNSSLQGFPYVCEVSKEFLDNWNSFSLLEQAFKDMKLSLKDLDSVIKTSQKSSADSKNLGAMKDMFPIDELADKNLTIGLPNGISDLKMIFEDLNGKWLKENVADGKDVKMLVTALQPLQKLYQNLKPLEPSWNKLKKDQKIGEVVGNITTILMNGKIVKSEYFTSKSEDIAKCTQGFSHVSNIYFGGFDKFYSNLAAFDGNLKLLRNTLESTMNSPILVSIKNFYWPSILPSASIKPEAVESEVKKLRENQAFQEMTKLIFDHSDGLERSKITEMGDIIKYWPEVKKIHESPTDIGLIAAMECLNKLNFDYSSAEAFSLLDQGVQALKNQSDAQGSMKVFGEAIGSLITSDKKLKETLSGMKVVRRRRRDAQGPGPKGLLKLADSRKLTQELAKGVDVLREMSDVFENQERVLKVAKAPATVDSIIYYQLPEFREKWTVENKKALEKLVDEVNQMNDKVEKNRSLKTIWKLFATAQSVNGAPIESRILGTLVYKRLGTLKAAPDFKDFPPLQLDFTGSRRIYLREAFTLLRPISDFFDDFFASGTSNSNQPEDSPNYLLYAGVGAGVLLLIALGVGGYFGRRKYMRIKLLRNPERVWIYNGFCDLFLAVSTNSFDKAMELMAAGVYVNTFANGRSCLHESVRILSPELVEELIMHGADRNALDANDKTPLQSLVEGPKAAEIRAIFEKYKDKQFRQKIPALLQKKDFKILWLSMEDKDKFAKRFKANMVDVPSREVTHLIVDVDGEGCYHFDPDMERAHEILLWIVFGSVVVVPLRWATQCMKWTGSIHNDYRYRLKKISFLGRTYSNLDDLKKVARGRFIKWGHGIKVSLLTKKDTPNAGLREQIKSMEFDLYERQGHGKKLHKLDPQACSYYNEKMNANMVVFEGKSIDEFHKKVKPGKLAKYTVKSLDQFTLFLLDMPMTRGEQDPAAAPSPAPSAPVPTAPTPAPSILARAPSAAVPSAPASLAPAPSRN